MSAAGVWAVVLVGGTAAGAAAMWASAAGAGVRRLAHDARLARRRRQATAAALDASLTDPAFDPARIRGDVSALLALVEHHDDDAPEWTPELAVWREARQAFLGAEVRVDRAPDVDILRVVNREGTDEDQVVVRVRWRARRASGGVEALDERWTLGLRDGVWVLLAAHGDPTADTLLRAPLVAAPDVDDETLAHAGLSEVADAVDDRFMPALLDSTVRRLVEAWSEATNGQPAALDRRAQPDVRTALLRVGDGWRVLNDARVERWSSEAMDPDGTPPTVTLAVRVSAAEQVRYTDRPSTGSARVRTTLELRWTLAATGPADEPWQLVASTEERARQWRSWPQLVFSTQVRWGRRSAR